MSEDKEWFTGVIKFYNDEKGFGFITCHEDGNDYFIHISNVNTEPIQEREQVIYQLAPSRKKEGTMEAVELRHIDKFDDVSVLVQKYFATSSYELHSSILKALPDSEAFQIVSKELSSHKVLNDLSDYKKYKSNIEWFLSHFTNEELQTNVNELVTEQFTRIAADNVKYTAWFEGFYESEPPKDAIEEHFLNGNNELRKELLQKLNKGTKKYLLLELLDKKGADEALKFTLWYVKSINNILYNDSLTELLIEPDYWEDKEDCDLYVAIIDHIKDNATGKIKFDLYKKGYLQEGPIEYIMNNIQSLEMSDVDLLLERKTLPDNKVHTLLKRLIEVEQKIKSNTSLLNTGQNLYVEFEDSLNNEEGRLIWLFNLAKKHLSTGEFEEIKKQIIVKSDVLHLFLWERGYITEAPYQIIKSIVQSVDEPEFLLNKWLENEIVTVQDLQGIILYNLSDTIVKNRFDLRNLEGQLAVLRDADISINIFQDNIPIVTQEFIGLLQWLEVDGKPFSLEEYASKLSYLQPEKQQTFLKRLFQSVHKGELNVSVDDLETLLDVNPEEFYKREGTYQDIPLDISVHVVVEAIKSLSEKGEFLFDGELLKIVLHDLSFHSTYKVLLSDFFELCEGRMIAEWDWKRSGEIRKVNFGKDNFYWAIEFSPGEERRVRNNWGGSTTKFVPNPAFQLLKEEVKKLPGRKWNPEKKHWGVPAQYEKQVQDFAEKHRFYIHDEGSNYRNNVHLASLERKNVPRGITFCEGRKAKGNHNTLGRPFWWCCNESCFQNCETFHDPDEWENYTLLDFCEIMNLNTDDVNRLGDVIERGKYYQFISTINRFNRLLDRLYCESCKQIMYPVEDSHFAHHRVTRFHCKNDDCDQHHKEVYLHHCLNGKCNGIIDSRISAQCPNGLYICSNTKCGSCCSHEMLSRRYENLQKTGGYIHPNLVHMVENNLGHLERGKYFCYECGREMDNEEGMNVCSTCEIEYEIV